MSTILKFAAVLAGPAYLLGRMINRYRTEDAADDGFADDFEVAMREAHEAYQSGDLIVGDPWNKEADCRPVPANT